MKKKTKILLTQPNYSSFGRRVWKMIPYSLGLLNASLKDDFESDIFDPNFGKLNDREIQDYLKKFSPDIVGVSSISTDYYQETEHMIKIVRDSLPSSKIIFGGVIPTVSLDIAKQDKNVDYWFIGEGESRVVKFFKEIEKKTFDVSSIEGIAYYKNNKFIFNQFEKESKIVNNLDSVSFPNYGSLDSLLYGNETIKYTVQLVPKQYPFAVTSTSRGCPFNCTFCSGWTVSGKKVRMRSSENVLKEIDELYSKGFKEIIFLDDHFLFNKQRAEKIMNGLIERKYDLSWKCVNVNISNLDEHMLDLMKKSGSYQITVSIESGNEKVLKEMIKKPFINLEKAPIILKKAKEMGFELFSNFVMGYPDETWEQIRDTFRYAEKLPIDYADFHIATPLPQTGLMDMCIKKGLLKEDIQRSGFCLPLISTEEFTPEELRILRTYEWDRINFSSKERKEIIARMEGITLSELEQWRKDTRRRLGVKAV